MTGLSPDPLYCLSLQVGLGHLSYRSLAPTTSKVLSFYRDEEGITIPVGAHTGVDPHVVAARWGELVAQRRPEALMGLRPLFLVLNDEADSDHVRSMYLSWAEDAETSLKDRIAAATTAGGYPCSPGTSSPATEELPQNSASRSANTSLRPAPTTAFPSHDPWRRT